MLLKIIQDHPNVDFYFYGKAEKSGADQESDGFIDALHSLPNALLNGIITPKDLAKKLIVHDGFLLCYDPSKELNSGSNSHKLLEYMAIGKIIVSSYLFEYENTDLFQMSNQKDNSDFALLFENAIENIEELNGLSNMDKRRKFALDNSYSNQINRIEDYLIKHQLIN
jgi:hypothetical protein